MVHNPLTISNDMKKLGFVVEGIYFYHFHPVPPFENLDKMYFRKKHGRRILQIGGVFDCFRICCQIAKNLN